MNIMDIVKELLGWLAVVIMFTAIILIVITGGGALSPTFWSIVFYK